MSESDVEAPAAPAQPAAPAATGGGIGGRLGAVRARVRAVPGGALAWRVGITLAGVAVIVVGIVLLPLPGPGWLIIFAGLGLLASEYEWASRLLARARSVVSTWTQWALRQPLWLRGLIGLASVVFVAAVLAGSWFLYDLI